MSLQHSILKSTEDAEPFHTSVSLTQLAPETFRAATTGELHNCKAVNLKTFKVNIPHACLLGRIRVCDLFCHFNNYLLLTARYSSPLPSHAAADSPTVLAQTGNKPVQGAKPAEKQTYKEKGKLSSVALYP